jgi:Virulence protein
VRWNNGKEKNEVSILRASTAEYLTFLTATGQSDVNAIYSDENVWLSQKMIGLLYGVESHTITYHLQKAFKDGELDKEAVTRNFRVTASDSKMYDTKHFNLKAIIAVGHKVDSPKAVQFRKWANDVIEEYTIKGFAMDDERLKNGGIILTKDYPLGDSWRNSSRGCLSSSRQRKRNDEINDVERCTRWENTEI